MDFAYFQSSGVSRGPLTAPDSGTSGGNGVFHYGTSSSFPGDSFEGGNYWVDVVFVTSVPPDTTAPTVASVTPPAGATKVSTASALTVTFSENMGATTIGTATIELRNSANVLVPATVTYSSGLRTATLHPSAPLNFSMTYAARVRSGSAGVRDVSGNALAADYTWSFTTAAPPPTNGPGGPILVVSVAGNPFSVYYAEILRAEGLNAFTVADVGAVTSAVLANYDVVILGEVPLTAAQVTMFSDWVTAGGNLIAMRPDKKLASLLGLTDAAATLPDAYLQVNTAAAPGAGIVGQTMQFHGTADRYTLSGATSIATLFSTAAATTANPAVTVRSVGSAGGQAAAFTYDLARSVVYTRQGNPAWAGQERDGLAPMRSDDLFFGGAQPNYVDLTKVAIPQADEQQRLLANLIGFMNADRKPLPKFWYLPRGLKAAIVMTGDDHGSNGTAGRFDVYNGNSAPGCSVDDWECVRASSYIYPNTPIAAVQAEAYSAQGFDIGVHITTNCLNYDALSLSGNYDNDLAVFAANFPNLPAPETNRTHCIAWSDYASQPQVALAHGIRLDTNYYYYPDTWVNNVPGVFTGSGLPMRFAAADGSMIDVYQATTQMTDESGQAFPFTSDTLLDRALGAEGYYGTFVANMHTDTVVHAGSVAIVASAQARGVPVISAKQLLDWVDGRNQSTFDNLVWAGNTLTFSITAAPGSRGLRALMPTASPAGSLTGISRGGVPLDYSVQTTKGVSYAMFDASGGAYLAQYGVDTMGPGIGSVTAVPSATGATVTWTSNEPSTSRVDYGTSPSALTLNATAAGLTQSHTVVLTGLTPSTPYFYRVTSADAGGRSTTAPASAASFTTTAPPAQTVGDTTAADFGAGTSGTGIYVSQVVNGELMLAPSTAAEFLGSTLPAGWSNVTWNPGGTGIVSGGRLVVDGARVSLDALSPVGQRLEFGATFSGEGFEHVGFGLTFNESPWMMFSTGSGGALYARSDNGATSLTTLLPGSWLGTPHRFRIDWTSSSVVFFIDNTQVASHAIAVAGNLRPIVSNFNVGGGAVAVDWLYLTPYATSGTFTSRVLDAGGSTGWQSVITTATVPAGTALVIEARFGNTAVPDGTWTAFATVPASGSIAQTSRYVQYRATLAGNAAATPMLEDITISTAPPVAPPSIVVNDARVVEGNAGTVNGVFTVSLSVPSTSAVSVPYATADGTGTAPTDYTATSGTLTFAPGVTTLTVGVPVQGDLALEPDETFVLNLSAPTGATLGRAQGVATIVNDDVAAISIANATIAEGNSGTTPMSFAVTLSSASTQTVTAAYSTGGGTATAGSDYTSASGTVTFAPGSTSQTVPVSVLGDVLSEPNETFQVTLSAPSNATLATAQATGTITNDDALPGLTINSVTVTEGNTGTANAVFTVTLSAVSGQAVTVNYATANGTATAPADYTAASGTLTFAAGTTTQTINVPVVGDTLDEANETFVVNLSAATNATITTAQGTGTITDNDAVPTLAVNSVLVTEGNTGTANAAFTVTLSAASGLAVTVNYATANGTATAPADYTAASGTLTFAAGTTTQTITVPVVGDALDEANETFVVNLSTPTNATIATAQGTGTISDNDIAPTLAVNSVTVTEGNTGTTNAVFTVTLSAVSGLTATVNYATANGTATAPADYTAASGTLTFTPGTTSQTITVPVVGDTLDEANETFAVNLSTASNATIATAQGTGTITDNDAAPTLAINSISVTEGNTGTLNAAFTVTLSPVSGQTVTVNYATANGTATAPADYTAASGTLTFAAGTTTQTINIAVVGDTLDEPNHTFVVNLSGAANATITTAQGTGTIVDNDATPTLAINSLSVTEGNTGTVNAVFTVTLNAASGQTVTVNYTTANGTATAPADYTTKSGTLTFAAGTTTQTISIAVVGDVVSEPSQTFVVNLSGATNATIATAQGTGTIVDNDTPAIAVNSVTVTEGNSGTANAVFTVTLSQTSAQTVTVNYATANGTATSPADYTAGSGTLSFAAGTTSRTINVAVVGDTLDEANETFVVNLSSPVNSTIATAQGTGTITDNDTAPSLSVNNVTVTEGNTGTVNAVLTISLSAVSGQTVTVNYATANGTATTTGDYTATSGTATFAAGTTTRTITVVVRGDTLDEANETINLNLSGAVNATIADAQGVVTITDDDAAPSLSINSVSVAEGNSGTRPATFTVTLSAASGQSVTVNYATSNLTASSTSDYIAASGTLTFAAGTTTQTIAVSVRGDTTSESSEIFLVTLSGAVNAGISSSQGLGIITNDD